LTGLGDPEQISGSNVSASLFDVLRTVPAADRRRACRIDVLAAIRGG
jgi:hypothetical protein